MAREDDEIQRLLAEVDQSLSGKPAPGRSPAKRGRREPERTGSSGASAFGGAVAVGLVAAVVVFVAGLLLPFVPSWWPAIGAFLGAFGAWVAASLLGRR